MLVIRLPSDLEERLQRLADKTGRTKSFYVREAIIEHLEDIEDTHLAIDRLENAQAPYYSDEVKRELGLSI